MGLKDVAEARQQARIAQKSVENVNGDQRMSSKLGMVMTLQANAATAAAAGDYAKAVSLYEEVRTRCAEISADDKQRGVAVALRDKARQAQAAADKAMATVTALPAILPAQVTTHSDEARRQFTAAGKTFEKGDFSVAQTQWQLAWKEYALAERCAGEAQQAFHSREAYRKALKQADVETLSRFGGELWRRTEAKAKDAQDAGLTAAGGDKWRQASELLLKAGRHAMAERAKWDKYSTYITAGNDMLRAGLYEQAAQQAKRAGDILPDHLDAKVLSVRIDVVRLWGQVQRVFKTTPKLAPRIIEQLMPELSRLLELSPDDAEGKEIRKDARALRVLLADMYRLEGRLVGHRGWVTSAVFGIGGRQILSGGFDDNLRRWDVETRQPLKSIPSGGDVLAVDCSPDGTTVVWAVGSKLMVWSKAQAKPAVLTGHLLAIRSVAFSPAGGLVATGAGDDTVRLWSLATSKGTAVFQHGSDVNCVAFSPDGKIVASGGDDKLVKVWDVKTAGPSARVLAGHDAKVMAVAFSPDGKHLASSGADKTIRIWDIATGKTVKTLTGCDAEISTLAYRPDGRRLASAGGGGSVRLWDPVSGKCTQVLGGHTDWVRVVRFSPDGRRLASGGDDKIIILWARGLTPPKPTEPATIPVRR